MPEQIVVVGGGAGGLELVVWLARKLRRQSDVELVLVDRNPAHIWKPLLHEVATGSLNSHIDETSYRMLARKHRFRFVLGNVTGVNRETNRLQLSGVQDENGVEFVAARTLDYDYLVLAVGSLSNDFGTPGVARHAMLLDSRVQAERFHRHFINQLHRVSASATADDTVSVVIVGGGATGVELAADLHHVASQLHEYGFESLSIDRLKVCVVEASPRLLAQLPERISESVRDELGSIGVQVLTDTIVSAIEGDAVKTRGGQRLTADISVWAAGIKAPAFIADSGFKVDHLGRAHVEPTLQVVGTTNLFAIGDCCACAMDDGKSVPPRAQSAHQMASTAGRNLLAQRAGNALKPFHYQDFGSLVSLSRFSTVGNLMGNLMRGTLFVEGWLARAFYLSLYRMHQRAIYGSVSTLFIMLGDRIYKATRSQLKLH